MSKLYCDGSCNPSSLPYAWATVVDEESKDVVRANIGLFNDLKLKEFDCRIIAETYFGDVVSQQNNGAELVGLVMALRIALKNNNINEIFCDSQLLVDYWSKKDGVNKKTKTKMDPNKSKYVDECVMLREQFEKRGSKITKISGKLNKADLGFHR